MSDANELNTEIDLFNVRISYPHIFEPKAFAPGDKPRYSAKFLLSKDEHIKLVKQIAHRMKELAASSYTDKKLPAPDKLCMRDGDSTGKEEEEGYWVVSASEYTRPHVVHRDRSPLAAEDDVVFPGCRVNAKIRLWAQDNKWGRRINANLLGVQFVAEDERLGNGVPRQAPEEMFDDVSSQYGSDGGDDPFGGNDDSPF